MLPNGVYRHGKKFRLRIYIGAKRVQSWHYFKAHSLEKFWPEWSKYLRKKDAVTMAAIFDRYEAQEIPRKAPDTQAGDIKALQKLRIVFSDFRPDQVEPWHVVRYVENRGEKAPVRANREKALLSHIFTKCQHWGVLSHNPAKQLQYKMPETPRDRYVTDAELERAVFLTPPPIALVIRFAVATGLRRRDILQLRWKAVVEDGITVTLSKTRRPGSVPKRLLFLWTDELIAIYKQASELSGYSCWELVAEKDQLVFGISESALDSAWRRLQLRMVGEGFERFQFRDLRAKHATDTDERGGDAQRHLAHTNASTTARHYTRKPTRINLDE